MRLKLLIACALWTSVSGFLTTSIRSYTYTSTVSESIVESPTALEATPLDKPAKAAVDGVALITFAAIGKSSHAPDGSIDVAATLAVAAPFLLSWFATSPLTTVYEEVSGLSSVALQTARGWIVAIPLGIALRGFLKGYVPPTSFIVVTMVATLVILALARVVFTLVEEKLASTDTK